MGRTIQWYPGHMAKAKRILADDLKLVDVVIEVLDARLPCSSSNPVLKELIGTQPSVVALNKADLADPSVSEAWIRHFENNGRPAAMVNAIDGRGLRQVIQKARQAGASIIDKLVKKGLRPRPIRLMIVGIPNVGKSSLVNRIVKAAPARTGNRPGVTRGRQWVRVEGDLDLLDTPGILPPSLPDQRSALRLGICGAIKDTLFDPNEAVLELIQQLETRYPGKFFQRYCKNAPKQSDSAENLLEQAARDQGMLGKEGKVQIENMARMIIADFRQGRLGSVSFETPEE